MAYVIGRVGWRNYVSPLPTIWNNLTHYYSADNTAIDSKGSIHGTLVNGATYSAGKINSGFQLDGVNDYVNVGNLFGFDGTTPFSISFIFKLNANVANYAIKYLVGNQTRTAFPTNGTGAFLYTGDGGANNRLGFALANNGNRLVVYIKNNLAINTFYHCVISYNGNGLNSGLNTYINGVSEKLSVFSDSLTLPINSSSQLSTFGSTLGTSDFFNGAIDEVGVWDRALTSAEAAELYNGGAGKQYVATVSAYTARTAAFATATGITDATILNALNTFDTGLISNGLDTKMKALYPFVGGTANTHKFNFMDARDSDAAFRLAFNGGWVHSSTGAQPNGTNGYANTYFNHVNNGNDKNNFGLTIYSRTNSTGYKVDIGAVTDSYSWIALRYNSTLDFVGIYDNSYFYGNYATSSLGLFTALRNSLTSQKFFQNGILKGQRTGFNTQADINLNIYISCRNLYSVASNFSDRQLAFSGIHDSLTDTEVSTFYNLVQALQTSLSRQV